MNPGAYIERLDPFPDGSGRSLVVLTQEGKRDTETWDELDMNRDVAQQHSDLSRRLHRLMKIRVRRYLNAVANACEWQELTEGLARSISASGFDISRMPFRAVLLSVVSDGDFPAILATCCEQARCAGYISGEEAARLRRYEMIDVSLDPRPADVPPGPALILREL